MTKPVIWLLSFALFIELNVLHASTSPASIKDYVHTIWTQREGAPADVQALAQTPDGWYWLGTSTGLYRFDGVNFERQPVFPAPSDKSQSVARLLVTHDGNLCVVLSYGGLMELTGADHSTPFSPPGLPSEVPIDAVDEDADNHLWALVSNELYRLDGSRWNHVIKSSVGLAGVSIDNMLIDRSGSIWIFRGENVYRLVKGQSHFEPSNAVLPNGSGNSIWQTNDGNFWTSGKDGKQRVDLSEGAIERKVVAPSFAWGSSQQVIDRDGAMWLVNCEAGALCRYPDAEHHQGLLSKDVYETDKVAINDHILSGLPMTALIDRNGDLWLGTKMGLGRFHKPLANVIHFPEPLIYFSVTPSPDGSVWVGTASSGFENKWWLVDGNSEPRPWADFVGDVTASFRDTDGSILMGGASGLRRFDGKSIDTIDVPEAVKGRKIQSILRDSKGRLWVAFRGAPVFQLDGKTWIAKGGVNALTNWHPIVMAAGQDGAVWFGYAGGELFVLRGSTLTHYSRADGLQVGSVTAIGPGNPMLVGGELGLATLSGDHFQMLQTIVPGTLIGITGIALANDGCYWLNTEVGAVRIRAEDMQHAAQDPTFKMPFQLVDTLSGMPGGAQRIRPLPSLTQGSDGRLWFAQVSGLAWMDPKHVPRLSTDLSVIIRALISGDAAVPVDQRIDLPVGTHGFRIVYTALGALLPEHVTFRYRLARAESNWQFAGTDRIANFAGLGPGNYRFELEASEDGESWTRSPVSLNVRIEPAFYQTLWFSILCALVLLAAIVVMTRRHIHLSNERLRARLQIRHAERERIARDLHDTLLQGVQGLILRVHAATSELPTDHAVSVSIDQALARGEEILVEGRNRLLDLRLGVGAANNLTTRIAEFAQQCTDDYPAAFNLISNDEDQEIVPVVGEEAFLITREAVLNAFRHANARQINVELDYGAKELVIQVSDNGDGISPHEDDRNRTSRRWGLVGMKERAATIGAGLIIKSIGGQGTEVTLSIPARIAYVRKR